MTKERTLPRNGAISVVFCLYQVFILEIRRGNVSSCSTRTLLQRQYAVSLACLEIRSRNDEAINSIHETGFYRRRFFYFLLYRPRYFLFVSELIQYTCQRQPEIRLWSQALRVYKYTKIQGPRFQRNYIIARDQKSDLHGTSFQSSPKVNCMFITRYNESLQHPTIAVLLIRFFFFFFSTTQQCSLVPK